MIRTYAPITPEKLRRKLFESAQFHLGADHRDPNGVKTSELDFDEIPTGERDQTLFELVGESFIEKGMWSGEMREDLAEVGPNWEMVGFSREGVADAAHDSPLLGINQMGYLTFLGGYMTVAGKKSNAHFFIMYWDGKEMRMFAPEEGRMMAYDPSHPENALFDTLSIQNAIQKEFELS